MDKIYTLLTAINKACGPDFAEIKEDMVYFKSVDTDASFDEDEGTIDLTFNLAPEDPEGELTFMETVQLLEKEAAYLQKVKKLIIDMEKFIIEIEGDFYWREGDLNLRLIIGLKDT